MRLREIKYLAVMWMAVLGVYLPVILSGRVLVDEPTLIDVTFNFMPNISWMAQSWKDGYFPLWNFHTHFGMPHLGYSHSGGMYPVGVLLFSLLPYIWAGSAMIIFHALSAGTLFYLCARQQGLTPLLSVAASLTFVLSGSYFGMTYIFWTLGSVCGFLLAWLSLHALGERPGLVNFAGAAAGVAWCGIAGDVELLTYGLMTLGLVMLLRSGLDWSGLVRSVPLLALSTAAGGLLIAVLAFPVMETVHFSLRGPDMPYRLKIISVAGEWEAMLLTFLSPFRYYRQLNAVSAFNHGLSPVYQCFMMPLLMGWALVVSVTRKSERPLAWAWALIFLYIGLRGSGVADRWLDLLPILGSLKFPQKGIVIIHILGLLAGFRMLRPSRHGPAGRPAVIILAGSGLAMMAFQPWGVGGAERYAIAGAAVAFAALTAAGWGCRWSKRIGGPVVAAAALIIIEVLALSIRCVPRTRPDRFQLSAGMAAFARQLPSTARYAVFESILTPDLSGPPPIFGPFELASNASNIVGPSRIQPARSFLYISQLYPAMVYHAPNGERYLDLWSMTNSGLIDRGRMHLLYLAGTSVVISRQMPIPYSTPYSLLDPNALAWEFQGKPGSSTPDQAINRLPAPAALGSEVTPLAGDALRVRAAADRVWVALIGGGAPRPRLLMARNLRENPDTILNVSLTPLARNGKFRLSMVPATGRETPVTLSALEIVNPSRPFKKTAEFDDGRIYINTDAMPRAFVVHRARRAKDREQLIEYLRDPSSFAPLDEVLLEDRPPGVEALQAVPAARRREDVTITSYASQRVEMDARLATPGFLVLTDSYFPGWKAMVSAGSGLDWETRIYPADLAFRTIFVPEGRCHVAMVYEPVSFRVGLWVSLAGLGCLAGAMIIFSWRRRARSR